MTVTVDSRRDLTLDTYRRVTVGGEGVALGPRARETMAATRAAFMTLLESDRTQFIYGVTSHAGEGARTPIPPDEQRTAARRFAARHQASATFGGGYLADSAVRGILFARLANFVDGHAKSRPLVAERIAGLLERPLPRVPLAGEVFSGEIVPLMRVMGGIDPDELEEGEPMALINGSPCAAALAAEVALRSRRRLELAEAVFALSVEALGAPLEAYDPALRDLWGDPHEADALDALGTLLAGSARDGRRPFQAPVSWRILPRVLGQAHRAVAAVEEVAAIALRSVTDNPVFLPPDDGHPAGRVFSTGGYHNASAYPAIDGASGTWADLCGIAERHTMKLHDGPVSLLPHHLAGEDGAPTNLLTLVQAGLGEEARHEAARTFLPMSESGGFTGQNDVPSPTFLAYTRHLRVAWCLDACLASLAVTGSRALWLTKREPAPALAGFVEAVRRAVPPDGSPLGRDVGEEVGRLTEVFGEVAERGLDRFVRA